MTNRESYVEKAKDTLDAIDANISLLEAKAETATGDIEREVRGELIDIKKTKLEAEAKLQELRSTGDGAWEDLKVGAEHAWSSVTQSVDNALQRFK